MHDTLTLRNEWMKLANEQTLDTVGDFFKRLAEHPHDYNTICYACGAAAVAAAKAMDRSPNGGITGFQAGAVMWEFIIGWGILSTDDMPRFIKIADLLYPQYDGKWTQISAKAKQTLIDKAKELLEKNGDDAHPNVKARWEQIAAGNLPDFVTVGN